MNFARLHERLRLELLRRIERGTLSVSLLARQTGYGQAHLSNFLRGKRQLSLESLDAVLSAQHLTVTDLMPSERERSGARMEQAAAMEGDTAPIVSHGTAVLERFIRPESMQSMLHLPRGLLEGLRPRATASRRQWQRFVAVRAKVEDSLPMEPVLQPGAVMLIDRHYNSFAPYRPTRPNLYAVRLDMGRGSQTQGSQPARLVFRYVEYAEGRLVLRPHSHLQPLQMLRVGEDEQPQEMLVGRIALVLNEA